MKGQGKLKNKLLSSILVSITDVQQALVSSDAFVPMHDLNILIYVTIGYLLLGLQFHNHELTLKHMTGLGCRWYSL